MTRIQVTDLADLITLLPYQLGFHPGDSLVVADVSDGRLHGVARVDLDEVTSDDVAAQCLAPLVRDGAREVLLAAFEDAHGSATGPLDHACRAAAALGLDVVRELLVRDGRYWSSGEGQPDDGRPLPEHAAVSGVAELVALGVAPLPGRASLAGLVETTGGERAARVAEAVLRRRGHRRRSWSSDSARRDWRDHLGAAAFGPTDALSPYRVAVLAVALLDRDWRDGVIAGLCAGSLPLDALPCRVRGDLWGMPCIPQPSGRGRSRRGDAGSTDRLDRIERAGLRLVPGVDDDEPDGDPFEQEPAWVLDGTESRAVLDALLALCRDLPDETEDVAAAALTLTAHVAWWLGDGALARTALDRALRVCPGYRLAELFETVVAVGLRPALMA